MTQMQAMQAIQAMLQPAQPQQGWPAMDSGMAMHMQQSGAVLQHQAAQLQQLRVLSAAMQPQ
jgi:hypothetical protein